MGNVAWGDIVMLVSGRYKDKKLIVSTINSSGIWLREPNKDFAVALGPFTAKEIKIVTKR